MTDEPRPSWRFASAKHRQKKTRERRKRGVAVFRLELPELVTQQALVHFGALNPERATQVKHIEAALVKYLLTTWAEGRRK